MQALQDEARKQTNLSSSEPTFVHIVKGRERILAFRRILIPFSERCEQPGTMEDLPYFLSKPGLLRRVPKLYLVVKRKGLKPEQITVDDLAGTVLLYEFEFYSVGTGMFATNDRSGRGTLLAPKCERARIAVRVSRMILNRGAHAVLLSFQGQVGEHGSPVPFEAVGRVRRSPFARAAVRTRSVPAFLPLQPTYDATLATLGQKTRRNLRYYRRRAESELGCQFLPELDIAEAELIAFNAETMFAVSNRDALWRLRTQRELKCPLLMGLKDKDGKLLSILAGRRHKDSTEVLWQMNREGLQSHSLSTAMRAYCIEHEIARGAQRLYMEGGTGHSIQHAFEPETLIDFAMVRNPMVVWAIRKLSNKLVSPDNMLANMLHSSDTRWQRC